MKAAIQTATKMTVLATAALCVLFAPDARACPGQSNGARANAIRMLAPVPETVRGLARPEAATTGNQAGDNSPFIVGMWDVTLLAGDTVYDHAFQQLFSDGNEVQNSGLVPPAEGSVCYGVWKQQDARTFKVKHYGWTFDISGNFTGTFILTATITVGTPAGSNTYFGTFVADIVLPSGKITPPSTSKARCKQGA